MSLLTEFARVTKRTPCPVCGKKSWCLVHRDGHSALCARIESERKWGKAGWLHKLDGGADYRPFRTDAKGQGEAFE